MWRILGLMVELSQSISRHRKNSLVELLASLTEPDRQKILKSLSEEQAREILYNWRGAWARENQIWPPGDWRYWLLLAGRGFGKTRTGAEGIREMVAAGYRRLHLVAPTAADARDVMVQGESGLLSVFPPYQRPLYEPSKRLVTFHTGAVAYTFSADEPERLRGPQCDGGWCDELAAWRRPTDRPDAVPEAWEQFLFGLRLGNDPRAIITTTPKPIKIIRDLIGDPHCIITRASSYENRANLAPAFFDSIIRKYEGTRLGRQELLAEVLEDIPGALWTQSMIDSARVDLSQVPPLIRVVVAIDPAVTANEDSDETGMGAAGLDARGHVYVLQDCSRRATVNQWATAACRLFCKWDCDRIVAEVNNGGDLVEHAIHTVHGGVPFRAVRASRGKVVRAEPVSALYEQGRVHHVRQVTREDQDQMAGLEAQMCAWVPGVTAKSPDRMDWLVWAITDLVIDPVEEQFVGVREPYQISAI